MQVLAELLTIAGGPVMWAVLSRAQTLYSRYQEQMIQNIQECSVVYDANDPHNKNVNILLMSELMSMVIRWINVQTAMQNVSGSILQRAPIEGMCL